MIKGGTFGADGAILTLDELLRATEGMPQSLPTREWMVRRKGLAVHLNEQLDALNIDEREVPTHILPPGVLAIIITEWSGGRDLLLPRTTIRMIQED